MPVSPNMNLTIPVPSQTGGPQYANDEVNCFNAIDSHNHTSGQGVKVPINGLDINQNLDMNTLSVTNLKSIQFLNSAIAPGSSSLYMLGNNLYFRDGTDSFNVQITNGASVNVSGQYGFTGLPSGTASAAFLPLSGTFRFQSATDVGATTDIGPLKLRNTTTNSNAITITPPNPLPADYSLTLPSALPASDSFLVSSNTGNLSFQATSFVLPAGSMMMYGGIAAPTGWLFCDGSVISTTTYANLYAVLGASYNIGNELLGTFRLPDLRSKTAMGAGQGDFVFYLSGTATAGTLSAALGTYTALQIGQQITISDVVGFTGISNGVYYSCSAFNAFRVSLSRQNAIDGSIVNWNGTGSLTVTISMNNYSLGARGGSQKQTLRNEEIPQHNHGGSTGSSAVNFQYQSSGAPPNLPLLGSGFAYSNPYALPGSSHSHSISSFGNSDQHNNLAPFVTVNYIIKH